MSADTYLMIRTVIVNTTLYFEGRASSNVFRTTRSDFGPLKRKVTASIMYRAYTIGLHRRVKHSWGWFESNRVVFFLYFYDTDLVDRILENSQRKAKNAKESKELKM